MEIGQAKQLIGHAGLKLPNATQWADLGCGTGFFTNVLSSFLAAGSTVYAIDSNASAVKKVKVADSITLKKSVLDFAKDEWPFGKLDGIMMANSLHYVHDKDVLIQKLTSHLAAGGSLLIVEYDMDTPNTWVPFPITYHSLAALLKNHGFAIIEKISQMPSAFGRANMYAAIASK